MKKVGDLTIRELAEMCYNIRYCKECELYPWCNQHLSDAPGNLVRNNALEFCSGMYNGGGGAGMTDWISIRKELPSDTSVKLVTCKTKAGVYNVNRAYFSDGFWHGSGSMSNVIAWMDLPEPYKED